MAINVLRAELQEGAEELSRLRERRLGGSEPESVGVVVAPDGLAARVRGLGLVRILLRRLLRGLALGFLRILPRLLRCLLLLLYVCVAR